ncbi:MAG: FKBP-type peptidyl-prolyl cis-trans isomerase [Rhodoglobus sp.]|nr:FKBP-type peptidyl-prolyl cis-trans isomerase [Rhodoglobus sp.]
MRAALSILAAAGLVVSLAACSTGTVDASDCAATPSGSASNAVKVSGDFGAKPDVTISFPTSTTSTERTVVIAGDGETAIAGDSVSVDYTLFNGTTGVELASTEYTDSSAVEFPVDDTQFLVGIVKTLECSTVGSRVVGVIPPVDSFGDAGSAQLGVAPGEDLVFVVDILSIAPPVEPALPKADGVDQPATAGFPTVVLDDTGRPTVTIPDAAPPTELGLAVLKLGDGATVQAGDDVTVHYEGINWNTKVIFDESWARGTPATFNTAQVIAGFTAALVGQTVGSQVIVIIPPDQGYGEAGSPPDIGGTDTLVFVIDILGIA